MKSVHRDWSFEKHDQASPAAQKPRQTVLRGSAKSPTPRNFGSAKVPLPSSVFEEKFDLDFELS